MGRNGWTRPARRARASRRAGLRCSLPALPGDHQCRAPTLALVPPALTDLASQLEQAAFELQEPDLPARAKWVGRGPTAYAAYVALAEALGVPLVTDDDLIIEIARGIAAPLGQIGETRSSDPGRAAVRSAGAGDARGLGAVGHVR